jgi:5-formyltetrahydrofolate cyclo-ligase
LQTKTALRKYYRDLRRHIPQQEKWLASQAIIKVFFNISTILPQKKIAVYLAHDGELDLQCLIQQLWQQNFSLFLPVIDPQTHLLKFAPFTALTPMKKNIYGIEEPQTDFFIMPREIDVILMPLVAFDKTGARLGMGKGCYDKSFAFRGDSREPLLIGVAYACQQADALISDAWDVPLDAVITEKELILLSEIG